MANTTAHNTTHSNNTRTGDHAADTRRSTETKASTGYMVARGLAKSGSHEHYSA